MAITAKDYLELALTQVQGGGGAVAAKNQIRESIRSLFPMRDCYTLVRPTAVCEPSVAGNVDQRECVKAVGTSWLCITRVSRRKPHRAPWCRCGGRRCGP